MTTVTDWLKTLSLEQRIDAMAGGPSAVELAYNAGAASAGASEAALLGQQIADCTAESDIEISCCATLDGGHQWYDTDRTPPEDTEWVVRATRYLDRRGLLIRHPQKPHLVRWEHTDAVEPH